MVIADADFERVGRRDQQLGTDGAEVGLLPRLVLGPVEDVTVGRVIGAAQFQRDARREAEADHTLGIDGREAAVACPRLAGELLCRARPRDVDHAAGGVATKQRSLRPAQNFDPIDIDRLEQAARALPDVNIIDDHADCRIHRFFNVGHADTANVDRGDATGALLRIIDQHVRRRIGKIPDVGIEAPRQIGGTKCTQRGRDILQIFRPAARCDDDFVKPAVCLSSILSGGLSGFLSDSSSRNERRHRNRCHQQQPEKFPRRMPHVFRSPDKSLLCRVGCETLSLFEDDPCQHLYCAACLRRVPFSGQSITYLLPASKWMLFTGRRQFGDPVGSAY